MTNSINSSDRRRWEEGGGRGGGGRESDNYKLLTSDIHFFFCVFVTVIL